MAKRNLRRKLPILTLEQIRSDNSEWITVKEMAKREYATVPTILARINDDIYEARSFLGSIIVIKYLEKYKQMVQHDIQSGRIIRKGK
ncbi:MAG: hypothetical protein QQN44_06120 [Nitrosopumilus sp.]